MHVTTSVHFAALLAAVSAAILPTRDASGQAASRRAAAQGPVETWRGTSKCLVRPSACNDEVVVYRIASTNSADSVTLDARKIVRGVEEEMAVLPCRFTTPTGTLTCVMPRGTWRFHVAGDSLVGELRLSDGTKFRDVRTARAP